MTSSSRAKYYRDYTHINRPWAHSIGHPLTILGVVQQEAQQEAQTGMTITKGDEVQELGVRHKNWPIQGNPNM